MFPARVCPLLVLVAVLLVPASASAQSGLPIPARGTFEVSTTTPGYPALTYLAGIPVDVQIRYRPIKSLRSSSTYITVAARFSVSGKCPRRPSSADRRRLRIINSDGGVLNLRARATLKSGDNRICFWPREGRKSGYRKPRTVVRTMKKFLLAASAAEHSNVLGALNTTDISATSPITGTYRSRAGAMT